MSKTGLNGSLQVKNGKLYAVIGYNDVVTHKRKMKWISLGLDENEKKSVVNRALRDAISDFEDEYEKMLSGLRSPEDYPFLAFLTEWLETVKIKKVQESTINGYRQMVKGQITRYFGDQLTLGDITPRLVMRFYDSMRKEGLSERSILHYHNFLHGMFGYAVRQEIFTGNLMDRVERPEPKRFVGKFYSEAEVRALLAAAKDDILYIPIVLAAYYGVRRSEALGVSWSNIDFENKLIYIRQKVITVRRGSQNVTVISDEMKNESSRRTLPLIPEVENILLEHRRRQEEYREMFGKDYSQESLDMVCVDPLGNLITPYQVTEHFPHVLKQNGMRPIRYHDLRHTCASLLLNKDVNMKIIQMWLGHSSFKTTSDTYSHLEASAKERAGEVLSSILGVDQDRESEDE